MKKQMLDEEQLLFSVRNGYRSGQQDFGLDKLSRRARDQICRVIADTFEEEPGLVAEVCKDLAVKDEKSLTAETTKRKGIRKRSEQIKAGLKQLAKNVVDDFSGICELIRTIEWYEVFGILEALSSTIDSRDELEDFEEAINGIFDDSGLKWELINDTIYGVRDDQGIPLSDVCLDLLHSSGYISSEHELRAARACLVEQQPPDITGAVSHAMNAMEAVAKKVFNEPKKTLGEVIKAHRDQFPKPLDVVLEKMYGFASEAGARHGVEGHSLKIEDAELIVGIVSAMCSYLIRKFKSDFV